MINILMSRGNLSEANFYQVLKPIIKNKYSVVIVCLSYFPFQFNSKEEYQAFYSKGGEYYEKMINAFLPYGIKEDAIDFILEDDKTAIKKIQAADIIYLPGGAPELFMERIKALGIKTELENKNKIFIGSSAGAMIQFKNYHISKDNEYQKFSYNEGLDLLNGFHIEVHYNRKRVQKSGMKKVFRDYRLPIYVIPDDGLIVVDNNKINLYFTAKQIYNKKGVVKMKT